MLTAAAQRTIAVPSDGMVRSRAALRLQGVTDSQLRARLAARRWRVHGRAVVLHNGPLTRQQRWNVVLISAGPRVMLTAFTALEQLGLTGWNRDEVHVLVPYGAREVSAGSIAVRTHRTRSWSLPADPTRLRCQRAPGALFTATQTVAAPRTACGLLAAAVQQRITSATEMLQYLERKPRLRHRGQLLAALGDIDGGSQALSEIDFVRLCRRSRLPAPQQQTLRRDSAGRRRYLDATWRRADGRLVVAEIDGALHLNARNWWDDQLRQNDIALDGALILRYPSVVVRTEPALVAAQLRRALQL
jgi:hypothetical protein